MGTGWPMKALLLMLLAASLIAQVSGPAPSRPAGPPPGQTPQAPAQSAPNAPAPAQTQPAAPAQTQPAAAPQAPSTAPRLSDSGGFLLNNVSLAETIDILAKQLKINYTLDPRVKGSVTLFTYGEVKPPVDLMQFLETILRVNGAGIVKVGDLYRIVPINLVSQLPVEPSVSVDPKTLPDDERIVLNLIFLKYATATELDKLIAPFLGEGATHTPYEPANLIIIQDNARSMKRTMQLIALFDSDTFAGQRVRLFSIEHSRPTDLVKDLDNVFKAYSLSDKNSAVKFIGVDRINMVIAVAPNPGIFTEVENWINRLDVAPKVTAGAVTNYVYRVRYGRAETMAVAITALYTGNTMALVSLANAARASMVSAGMGYAGAVGGMNYGLGGGGGYGGGYGGYGGYGGAGAYGGSPYGAGAGAYGATPYAAGYPSGGAYTGAPGVQPGVTGATPTTPLGGTPFGQNLTGTYLGAGVPALPPGTRIPHVIPNPFDNTLLMQCTPQEYEEITNLLRQLDVPPRQVLIDAKIYEVDLSDDISGGLESCLASPGTCAGTLGISAGNLVNGSLLSGGLTLTAGALLSKNHQLMGLLTALESQSKARTISAPSVVATDSIPATINVGDQIPVATATAATGVESNGSSVFEQSVSEQSTGITLSIEAHVNSSGIVTMIINQQVSAPEATTSSDIDSPSFSNRSVSTQVTVQDGDTVAIGGGISEQVTLTNTGIPFLDRLPIVGALFGSKSYTKSRTELIVFLTPRVIYDTNQMVDATEELKNDLKEVSKINDNQ